MGILNSKYISKLTKNGKMKESLFSHKPIEVDLNQKIELPHFSPKLWSDLIMPHLNLADILTLGSTSKSFYTFARKYLKKIDFSDFEMLLDEFPKKYHKELLKFIMVKYENLRHLDLCGLFKQSNTKFAMVPLKLIKNDFSEKLEQIHHISVGYLELKTLFSKLPNLNSLSLKYNSIVEKFSFKQITHPNLRDLQMRLPLECEDVLIIPPSLEKLKIFKTGNVCIDLTDSDSLNQLTISCSSQNRISFFYDKEKIPKKFESLTVIVSNPKDNKKQENQSNLEEFMGDIKTLKELKLNKITLSSRLICESLKKLILKSVVIKQESTKNLCNLKVLKRLKISRISIVGWCSNLPKSLKKLTISRCVFEKAEKSKGDLSFLCSLPPNLERLDIYYAQQAMRKRFLLNEQVLRSLPSSIKSFRIFERFFISYGHPMNLLNYFPENCKNISITHITLKIPSEINMYIKNDVALGFLSVPISLLLTSQKELIPIFPYLENFVLINLNPKQEFCSVGNWSQFLPFFQMILSKCKTLELKGFEVGSSFIEFLNNAYNSTNYCISSQIMFKYCYFKLDQECLYTLPRCFVRLKVLKGSGTVSLLNMTHICKYLQDITFEGKFGYSTQQIEALKKKMKMKKFAFYSK